MMNMKVFTIILSVNQKCNYNIYNTVLKPMLNTCCKIYFQSLTYAHGVFKASCIYLQLHTEYILWTLLYVYSYLKYIHCGQFSQYCCHLVQMFLQIHAHIENGKRSVKHEAPRLGLSEIYL